MQNDLQCINCGVSPCELHHVVPLSLGGNDIDSNKVPLCSYCHSLIHNFNTDSRGLNWKRLQKEGIEQAKKQGKFKGKQPIPLNMEKFIIEYNLWKSKQQTAVQTMNNLSLKPNTFYRRVKEYETKGAIKNAE